jgi:hypothetical protein
MMTAQFFLVELVELVELIELIELHFGGNKRAFKMARN